MSAAGQENKSGRARFEFKIGAIAQLPKATAQSAIPSTAIA
jgi:hypothetical protein